MTIEDLLYGIMLASANDASVVLAEGISGSVESFAELMTKKAHEIGATNSQFLNPHGLTAPDHYSTARDLAILFRYAMRDARFREIVQTKFSSVRGIARVRKKIVRRRISVRNHNRLLWNFDGALGGKTGYTIAAKKCFVGAVERNGVTLIVSILGARDQWGDTKRLLTYGFDNYETLRTALPPAGKAAWLEPPVSVRREPNPGVMILPQEFDTHSEGSYVLQVASFHERERAELLAQQFRDKGFEASIELFAVDQDVSSFRVRVGPYSDLTAAQQAAQEILAEIGLPVLILPWQTGQTADQAG